MQLRKYKYIFLCLFALTGPGSIMFAQDSSNVKRYDWLKDSATWAIPSGFGHLLENQKSPDSILVAKWKAALKEMDSSTRNIVSGNKKEVSFNYPKIGRPWFHVDNGTINYQYNYRTGIDTPIVEKEISQHLISSTMDVTIANAIPIRLYYFERQSNSVYFKDFRDFKIELNTNKFQQLKQSRLKARLNSIAGKILDPFTKYARELSLNSLVEAETWLNYSSTRKRLIDAKELISSPDMVDTSLGINKDSLLSAAKTFVALYEKVEAQKEIYQRLYDSLNNVYVAARKKIQQVNQLAGGNLGNYQNLQELEQMAKQYGVYDKEFARLTDRISAIRTFAVGRTMPNQSNLTLKNTNVKGVDFVYNKNNFILAIAAGTIDFRVRDFVYSNQRRLPQYVYSVKSGFGRLEGNHIVITYFEGKKQLYAGSAVSSSQPVKGVSLATHVIGK